jgi:hypothetical protein
VTFNGSSYYNTPLSAVPTAETVFVVISTTSTAYQFPIGASVIGGRAIYQQSGSMTLANRLVADYATQTGALTTGVPFLATMTLSGGNSQMFVNGTGGSVSTGATFSGGGTTRIGLTDTAGYSGSIYEVLIYNSSLSSYDRLRVEAYLANKWSVAPVVVTTTGSPAISTYNGKTFYKFNDSGSFQTNQAISVDYLAIGGGGGGGGAVGGGGGAGGLVQATGMVLQPGTYSVTIGAGGAGGGGNGGGSVGGNTSFATFVVALGGGGGGGFTDSATNGGCGGGCGLSTGGYSTIGSGLQGYNGGPSTGQNGGGGGGGVGGTGFFTGTYNGGNGGVGIMYNIGTSVLQLGGGGGGGARNGIRDVGGTNSYGGGTGGGGISVLTNPTAGAVNTGGGGGGQSGDNSNGAAGGKGVFIISFG